MEIKAITFAEALDMSIPHLKAYIECKNRSLMPPESGGVYRDNSPRPRKIDYIMAAIEAGGGKSSFRPGSSATRRPPKRPYLPAEVESLESPTEPMESSARSEEEVLAPSTPEQPPQEIPRFPGSQLIPEGQGEEEVMSELAESSYRSSSSSRSSLSASARSRGGFPASQRISRGPPPSGTTRIEDLPPFTLP